jgi:hypothetical protein
VWSRVAVAVPRRWVCSTSKSDLSGTTKCVEFVAMIAMNLVTPKAAAKHNNFFSKPAITLNFANGNTASELRILDTNARK